MRLPIPDELRQELDRAQVAMDAMNDKLDTVIALLSEIRDAAKEQ